MEIKSHKNFAEINVGAISFFCDPSDDFLAEVDNKNVILLSNPSLDLNYNRIFNAAGEYNVDDVYFWGFNNKKNIAYLLEYKKNFLFYCNGGVAQETIKHIKAFYKNIDVLLLGKDNTDKEIIAALKPKIIFSFRNIEVNKFTKEKISKVKLNFKKVENVLYIFSS
ncbi:MAG: hypothetical protein KatS3mg097_371 [Candidatus Parcubacteria bacterium]|nr:MAG: hypothetical protein KatS3mg097_371 [Candidatus Parcubacteria bacterium]